MENHGFSMIASATAIGTSDDQRRAIGCADELAADPSERELCGSDAACLHEATATSSGAVLHDPWPFGVRNKGRNFE
jgi:hypothetical protein